MDENRLNWHTPIVNASKTHMSREYSVGFAIAGITRSTPKNGHKSTRNEEYSHASFVQFAKLGDKISIVLELIDWRS